MLRYSSVLTAALLLVAAAATHGLRTDRWADHPDLAPAVARLATVPERLGEWVGQPLELDAEQLTIARVAGHLGRRYVHRHTGAEVSLLIVCGRPGPVSVHTPDVCYRGAGYQPGPVDKWQLPDGESLWKATFTKAGTPPDLLRIAWAWSTSGPWEATESPRVTHARASVLYKLYVIRRLARADEKAETDPTRDFLGVLLPELRKCLSATP